MGNHQRVLNKLTECFSNFGPSCWSYIKLLQTAAMLTILTAHGLMVKMENFLSSFLKLQKKKWKIEVTFDSDVSDLQVWNGKKVKCKGKTCTFKNKKFNKKQKKKKKKKS